MAEQTPLTLTVVSDIHYYSKKTGTSGKAYEAANAKSQKLLAECPEVLEAACVLYVKRHSYGEYVFDWAWADACRTRGAAISTSANKPQSSQRAPL